MSAGVSLLKRATVDIDTFVQRLDGRVKFLYFIWATALVYVFYDPFINLIFLAVTLLMAFHARVARPILTTLLVIVVPWILIAVPILSLPLGFPWNKTVIGYIEVMGVKYPVYLEGFGWGFTWPLRIAVAISSALLFFLTTNQARLVATLFEMRVPFKAIYAIVATFQFIPLLAREADVIMQAQTARGLRTDVGLVGRVKNYLAVVIPLTLSTLNRVQTRAIALESRGFSSPAKKTLLYEARLAALDYAFLAGMLIATLLLALVYTYIGYSPIARLPWVWGGG
ncbi:energy-coupling factor transporter transmembrane protein EcfT [Infirmifilum lucidum]|uniref:Energy-coupling factor transporter transmembrane protein EcfT n=1 Tax=Infirmifilum lucidum TaxID=2776706 RepID=A0A7L9FH75_9CREN|nr:energy-coupling factor transporter transmembrane component T [Infirmifilum lucidum]QOJ78692.1 energy-coupling factor transporter transmembrane protein EcfT [Infirmifilum lucidum]